jgi:MscS family membrane protein
MKNILIGILIFLSASVSAQNLPVDVNLSPQGVVYNHLYYLQSDSYNPDLATKSFKINDIKKAKKTAIKLKQILDAKTIYVNIDALPQNNDYTDSVTGLSIYVIDKKCPEIFLEKINNEWVYSEFTVNKVPYLFTTTFPFESKLATYFSNPFWKNKFAGVELWQWLCLGFLVVLFLFLVVIIRALVSLLLKVLRKTRFYKSVSNSVSFKKGMRLLSLLISVQLIIYLIPSLLLPVKLNVFLIRSLEILAIFFVIFLMLKLVSVVFHYFGKLAEKTENTMDDQLTPVMKKIAQFIVWSVGIVYVLSNLNVNVTALLAGLSIGGLALALAAQDTVKNFFGSVMIFIDKPFQIGDWIHFDDIDGVVEEVGIRSTRIRTFANSLVYVPNAKLADATIDNMGLRKFRRYKTEIGVTYDTPPEIINVFVNGIQEIIKTHPTTKKDNFEVSLNSFGSSSLNILVYCFFEASVWSDELKGRHQVMYAIIKLASDLGVRFAFPTQTLHIEEFPEKKSDTPVSKKEQDAINKLNTSIKEIDKYFNKPNNDNSLKENSLGGE